MTITASGSHNGVLLADGDIGSVKCWGLNTSGQLGCGDTEYIGENETPASIGVVPVS